MSNLLEYIEPRKFIDAERQFCKDFSAEFLAPESTGYRGGSFGLGDEKLAAICTKNRNSFGRAIAAWYLKASGLSYVEIGELFEISATRAGDIVKTIRNQAYPHDCDKGQWDDLAVRRIDKEIFPTVSKGVQKAHRMIQTFAQMRDVEYLMDRHHTSQYALNSAVLRLGRALLQKQRDDVGAFRCICTYCKPVRYPEHIESAEAAD
jgi:hypothetical protein